METKEKIIATRHNLKSIELFMGYIDGYLSENITWNDLMPVVEKIEKIPDTWVRIYGDEKYFECEIDDANYTNADGTGSRFHIRGKTKIDAVYQAVLEFIKWYNMPRPTESNN